MDCTLSQAPGPRLIATISSASVFDPPDPPSFLVNISFLHFSLSRSIITTALPSSLHPPCLSFPCDVIVHAIKNVPSYIIFTALL